MVLVRVLPYEIGGVRENLGNIHLFKRLNKRERAVHRWKKKSLKEKSADKLAKLKNRTRWKRRENHRDRRFGRSVEFP